MLAHLEVHSAPLFHDGALFQLLLGVHLPRLLGLPYPEGETKASDTPEPRTGT